MDSFCTVYKKDYVVHGRGPQFVLPKKHNRKTVWEDYEFVTEAQDCGINPVDLANQYIKEPFADKWPKTYKRYFKTPLNREDIEGELKKKTVYMKDYGVCKKKADASVKYDIKDVTKIFETTMQDHYRDPGEITPNTSKRGCIPPECSIDDDHRLIESILKCKPKSEYMHVIGETGRIIMDNKLLGEINHDIEIKSDSPITNN